MSMIFSNSNVDIGISYNRFSKTEEQLDISREQLYAKYTDVPVTENS